MRRSVNLGCGHSFRSLVNLNGSNSAGVLVIGGIEINLSGGFFICSRKKHGALRIALHCNTCRNIKSVRINHHSIVRSGEVVLRNSKVHISVINNRGAGAHKAILCIVFALKIIQLAVFTKLCAVKIACLGCEVHLAVGISNA